MARFDFHTKPLVIEIFLVVAGALGFAVFLVFSANFFEANNGDVVDIISFVFQLFPGAVFIAMVIGGIHSASDFHFVVGLFINTIFYYWVGRMVVKTVVRLRQRS